MGSAVEMMFREKTAIPPKIRRQKHSTHRIKIAAIISTVLVELFISKLTILIAAINEQQSTKYFTQSGVFWETDTSKLHMITHCLVAAEAGQPLVLESHYD